MCDVDNKRGYAYVGRVEGTREISVPSNFVVNLKLLKKKKKKKILKKKTTKTLSRCSRIKKKKIGGKVKI